MSIKTTDISKVTKEMALEYHEEGETWKNRNHSHQTLFKPEGSLACIFPGVAYPCLEIEKNPMDAYKYTNKGNLVGVISNGTAVLGLGKIGALAGKPVMEGKALLFKIFAGLDAFDIEINETDPDKLVTIIKSLTPTFGGINLEDIKAPECFEIERRLKEECDIPVMHDDQHGTAIISSAGLLNALEIQKKNIKDIKLVVNGAGAAAISCTRLYIRLGVDPANVVMCDSKGVVRSDREDLNAQKREFATDRDLHTLAEAMVGADVFLGLSVADVITPEMLLSMADKPIVFALANPNPEIAYELAVKTRPDLIMATGRSDYPNQINNVIGFPYIFRGALDCRATQINEDMKIAAVYAIAALAKEPVPSVVDEAYGMNNLHFGKDYILPKALDPRLLVRVAPAVAKAAEESGCAQEPITDWDDYKMRLQSLMGDDGKMIRRINEITKANPKRVVIGEANTDNMLRAATILRQEGICIPVLLGNEEMIEKRAKRLGLDISGMEIINVRHDREHETRMKYAEVLFNKLGRNGMTLLEAYDHMFDRCYFGMMMVETGDADAFIDGTFSAGNNSVDMASKVIGIKDGFKHFATMHIFNTRRGTYFLADTAINPVSDKEALVDIARLADDAVRFFAHTPILAMLSYSNFGSNADEEEPRMISEAVKELHEKYPEIDVDGEMQANFALNQDLRDQIYPFNTIKGKEVNTLIFPNLSSANNVYRMMLEMGVGSMIGPVQMGLKKPVYFASMTADVSEIVNIASVAALDAVINGKK